MRHVSGALLNLEGLAGSECRVCSRCRGRIPDAFALRVQLGPVGDVAAAGQGPWSRGQGTLGRRVG